MVTVSRKILLILMLIPVSITIIGIAAWQNWGGIGTALQGAGGPVSKGFYNIGAGILQWFLSGGWPILAIGLFAIPILLLIVGGAITWQTDLPYKLGLQTDPNAAGSASKANTTQREPEEPEHAPAATAK